MNNYVIKKSALHKTWGICSRQWKTVEGKPVLVYVPCLYKGKKLVFKTQEEAKKAYLAFLCPQAGEFHEPARN